MSYDEVSLQSQYFSVVKYREPFDPLVSAYADPKVEFIRRHIPLDGRILDVGCGNGIFTARFNRLSRNVHGLDFSSFLLGQNPHRRLTCGDATSLPFRDEIFDVVFEANVLHHVPERQRVIREMARVSQRYVVLLEPNRYNPLMFGFSMAVRAERGGLKSCIAQLRREAGSAGLRVIAEITTGMISQNNTPLRLVPFLKRFDRQIWWGEYTVVIAEKKAFVGRKG